MDEFPEDLVQLKEGSVQISLYLQTRVVQTQLYVDMVITRIVQIVVHAIQRPLILEPKDAQIQALVHN